MEPTIHDTIEFLGVAGTGTRNFDVASQLDAFRSSAEFPLHLGAILAKSNDLDSASLSEQELSIVNTSEARQMAGLLLKQVVKNVNSIESIEEYLLGALCDDDRAIRGASANCISAMMSSESLRVWPTLPQKLQQMCEHGSDSAMLGATKCIALVCEDNSHELVTTDFEEFQISLFGIISQCIDHSCAEVRYQCFCAVRDVMLVVFNPNSGNFGADIDAGNFDYDDLVDDGSGGGGDENGGGGGPKIDSQNIDLLASIVCPRLLDQYQAVADVLQNNEAEQFRCVLLECAMSLMSQWNRLQPILVDLMPLIVKTLQNAHQNEMSAIHAAELICEISEASELGGYDLIANHMQGILQGLLNSISLDEFTLSFFDLGSNSNEPDDEPNVKIISGRIDETLDLGEDGVVEQGVAGGGDDDEDGGGFGGGGDNEDDEADASGSGLRPKAKWCLNLLSTAFHNELVEAIPTVFGIILSNEKDNEENAWIEKEAALTMLAELCDELYASIPQQGVEVVLNTCNDVISQSPISLMRSAAIRCLLHLLHGQAAAILDDNEDAPAFSAVEVFSLITASICDCNKYVQRVAIGATEQQIQSALKVWASEDETIDIQTGFGVSPQILTEIMATLIKNFGNFQLQSRVSLLAFFGMFAENNPIHNCLDNVAGELLALLASHWDSLDHLCYENAAVMNSLCDIIESLSREHLEGCCEGVVNRCSMLIQVARESSNNHAAGDIAAIAMDTISAVCDSMGGEYLLPAELFSFFVFFAKNAGTEWQLSRAALGVLGDFAVSHANDDGRNSSALLNEFAPEMYNDLLIPMMQAFDQVTTRVRSNALYCLSQWLCRTIGVLQNAGAAPTNALVESIQSIAAHSLANLPPAGIYNTNVVFCCLHLFNGFPSAFQAAGGDFITTFFVSASKNICGIDDQAEQTDAIFLFIRAIDIFASNFDLAAAIMDVAQAVMPVAILCAAADHLCRSNEDLHAAMSELLDAVLQYITPQAVRSALSSGDRKNLSQCFDIEF